MQLPLCGSWDRRRLYVLVNMPRILDAAVTSSAPRRYQVSVTCEKHNWLPPVRRTCASRAEDMPGDARSGPLGHTSRFAPLEPAMATHAPLRPSHEVCRGHPLLKPRGLEITITTSPSGFGCRTSPPVSELFIRRCCFAIVHGLIQRAESSLNGRNQC